MDTERHVIAEGGYGDGLSWLIWARRQPLHGAQPDTNELMSMIRVTSADGRVMHEGGAGGPALYPGDLMNVSTGGSDEGPYCLLARVHPGIRRVELATAAGQSLDVPVYDSTDFPEVRFAALLVPRELRLDFVAGLGDSGEELSRFDLTFHQGLWHRRREGRAGSGFSPSL
jgi:hypothetical protein